MMNPNLDSTSDRSLIQAIQAGEEQALNALYQRYADGLFTFIACRIDATRDAEDIWQETWLAIWLH